MKYSVRTLLLFVTICAVVTAAGVSVYRFAYRPFYVAWWGAEATGVSSQEANLWIWSHLQIPASASDVTYISDAYGCEAKSALSEGDFLTWCRGNEWPVEEITTPTPFFQPVLLPDDNREVAHGYRFSLSDGRGVFERDRSRVAFVVSEFP
jgi:hypothetical protein